VKPIKYLGQNFLTSKKIVEEIIRAADLKPDDVVLEIGPGKGILTEAILEKIPRGKLIAVEKDKRLAEYLMQKFHDRENFQLTHGDILKIKNLKLKIKNYSSKFKIVANIPYYITSRLLRHFLQSDFQPSRMVLMVQKEVAERIIGHSGKKNRVSPSRSSRGMITKHDSFSLKNKESILSISVKTYGQPKIIKIVPREYFSPKPKVDSAILLIDNISKDFFIGLGGEKLVSLRTGKKGNPTETRFLASLEKEFFHFVKQGFSSKRKFLKNNLKLSKAELLTKCGVGEKARAEDLSPENWRCLYKMLLFK
jgi:16S rRNA (adenine1518-N6/adenine1519-N6)-dimethyltransferase